MIKLLLLTTIVLFLGWMYVWSLNNFNKFLVFVIFITPLLPPDLTISIERGIPVLTLNKVLMFLLVLSWLSRKVIKGEKFSSIRIVGWSIILFLVLQFCSIFYGQNYWVPFYTWLGRIVCYYVIFFVIIDQIKDSRECDNILNAIYYCSIIVAALAVFEFVSGINVYKYLIYKPEWLSMYNIDERMRWAYHRSCGPFGGPLGLGFYLTITFPITLYKYSMNRSLKYFIPVILLLIAVLCTVTRGPLLAIIISLMMIVILHPGINRKMYMLAITGCCIGGVLLIPELRNIVIAMYEGTFIEPDKSSLLRYYALQTLPSVILERPFGGYGFCSITISSIRDVTFNSARYVLMGDYPVYYVFASESGLPAVAVFGFIIFYNLKCLFKLWKSGKDKKEKMLPFYLFVAVLGYAIVMGTTSHYTGFFVLFTLLALTQILYNTKVPSNNPDSLCKMSSLD